MPKVILQRKPVWYPADDVPRTARRAMAKKSGTRAQPVGAKVRASIEAGKVLILLSGRNRGRRVVCLGALPSGLLLVSGEFCRASSDILVRSGHQASSFGSAALALRDEIPVTINIAVGCGSTRGGFNAICCMRQGGRVASPTAPARVCERRCGANGALVPVRSRPHGLTPKHDIHIMKS